MTLLTAMEIHDGLIVASDGLASWSMKGQEHLPKSYLTDTEKIHIVAPRVIYGVCGSLINWNKKLKDGIQTLLLLNKDHPLNDIANAIAQYLPVLYSDRINNPDFFIALLLAGFSPDGTKPVMYTINDGKVMAWGDDHPWMTLGDRNDLSDAYIKTRYSGKFLSRNKTIILLKDAIADTSKQIPEIVGGHTFVYEITLKGTTRLE